jgi:hypothetical protein
LCFATLQQSGVLPFDGALLGDGTGFGRWPNGEVVPARAWVCGRGVRSGRAVRAGLRR